MANIIIKDRDHRFGKTRSEQSKNLEREGWGTGFASPEAREKCEYLERKAGIPFPRGSDIEKVK